LVISGEKKKKINEEKDIFYFLRERKNEDVSFKRQILISKDLLKTSFKKQKDLKAKLNGNTLTIRFNNVYIEDISTLKSGKIEIQ